MNASAAEPMSAATLSTPLMNPRYRPNTTLTPSTARMMMSMMFMVNPFQTDAFSPEGEKIHSLPLLRQLNHIDF